MKSYLAVWRSTYGLLSVLLAVATIVSLSKQIAGIQLYGSPQTAHEFYEWLRNNLFELIYWLLFSWWTVFALPDWMENIIAAYVTIGFAQLNSLKFQPKLRPTPDPIVQEFFDQGPGSAYSQMNRFQRFINRFRHFVFWPRTVLGFLRGWKRSTATPGKAWNFFGMKEPVVPPDEWYDWVQLNRRYHMYSFLILAITMLSATLGFFHWNELERIAGL